MALILTEDDVKRLSKVLQELMDRTEADDCLVCDSGGFVLAQEGENQTNHTHISALGAGVFAASRELAKLMGEQEFSTVYHQGANKSLFISAVNSEVLLVVIFSDSASVGLVKLYTAPAAAECRSIFADIKKRGGPDAVPSDHRQFVLRQDGNIFGQTKQN